ncbi:MULTISPECIES: hypothetical protein [unclassified Bacillus (in: firmicutes)]|uniref:hypothetical protein n=1 Tax=unclassified Bacillus (in: firmicutes) TaxID=185979 RepID=UPI001BE6D29E|nr:MULTISPECIES: hypothetical protein [unclassified Bacillus (in: firmicutes)]MBT2640452.1 hypothetical protein [Bacillus sp. ISL-39]MBT2663378.1 hypothetical protein [Bacillus sp. ISL-45]
MKDKLSGLFSLLRGIGALALTLSFFEIGKEFFQTNLLWFLVSLWVGLAGSFIIEKMEKTTKKNEL